MKLLLKATTQRPGSYLLRHGSDDMGRKRKSKVVAEDLTLSAKKQKLAEGSPKESLPEGIHHYQTVEEVPWDLQKYWQQGYSIFSKYDEGIWMTDDAWFGVTHESVANTIAQHVSDAAPSNKAIIIDAFCGVGGNTIAFALSGKWKRVYAIEKDAATLACAKHNAEIYGVADKITWFHGDCFELLGVVDTNPAATVGALKAIASQYGIIFASPPWGGPGYRDAEVFDLESMEPYSFSFLYQSFKKITSEVVLYLPRTSNLRQISKLAKGDAKTQVVHYCTNGASRALSVYFGNWGILKS